MNNLEFARELQKTFVVLGQDVRRTPSSEKNVCAVVARLLADSDP